MKVKLFSKDPCTYCDQARALLASRKIDFLELKLNVDFTRDEIIELYPNARTYPIVIVDDKFIGGFEQLSAVLT